MVKKIIILFLFILLLLPYLLLFKNIQWVSMDWQELIQASQNTLIQSSLSAIAVIIFGLWGAVGLCSLTNVTHNKYFEFICLTPSFLPSLFFVAAILQILNPFPFGIVGIILIHTLTYVGLAAIFLKSILENKFHTMSEQAYLEGASQSQFLFAVIKNMPVETVMIFIFLFVQFFTSFSVPLLVGMQNLTIETLIYQKIRTTGALSSAMMISFFESVFIAILLLFYRTQISTTSNASKKLRLLGSKYGLIPVLAPIFLFVSGTSMGSSSGISQFFKIENSHQEILPLTLKSLELSIFVGFALILFLSLLAYAYKNKFFDKFLLSFIPLSTVLVALSLLLVNLNMGFLEQDFKMVLAMVILLLPVLYRFELKTKLYSLESQIEVATMMGANSFFTFKKIVFPQVLPSILFLSGLGAFWTIGDFAISQIIYGKNITLALYIQSLVGSYRLELANLLVLVLLFLGFIVFLIFKEMSYVVSQKN
jgi:thiamine transport system permease protein